MPVYTIFGATIDVAKGSQRATVRKGDVFREFRVINELDAPTPQVQAERFAHELHFNEFKVTPPSEDISGQ